MRSEASPSKSIRSVVAATRMRVKKRLIRDLTTEARLHLKKKLEIFVDVGCSNYRRQRDDDDGECDTQVFLLVKFDDAMMNMRSSLRFSIYDNREEDEGEVWRWIGLEG
ncbi:hypothetical protein D8674_009370 [Pyrus ussuriensis x Pyrus communis]|uniref:Uncharacterized protein n=1 Tax=Pyrus ussuriensis x Pyrus communis TaxID=2448454 RepID=A0A5N5F7R0_9ROSA|nr:hypothetical protein D8674_009370 [Pyrus ussuriensis x Pyrus communis]